jgi:hypothetical protein
MARLDAPAGANPAKSAKEITMRYLMMVTPSSNTPPTPEQMAAIGKLTQDLTQSGALVSTGALLPPSKGAKVRLSEGKFTVTDGPYPETKELIVGWAVVNASSKEEAVAMARQFLQVSGDGETEIRQLMDGPGGTP